MKRQTIVGVEKAVVRICQSKSHGILIPGNMILTAAHCVSIDDDYVDVNDAPIERIRTVKGLKLTIQVMAVDMVSDIAILGSLDEQEAPREAEGFEEFCRSTKPITLYLSDFALFKSFPVKMLNANGKWTHGTATRRDKELRLLTIESDEQIKPGASGGPIINDSGELVGVISHGSFVSDVGGVVKAVGWTSYPPLTLPPWVCRRIFGPNLAQWIRVLKSTILP